MSNVDPLLTSIDDYLVSIAEGLHQAQVELDRQGNTGVPSSYGFYVPKLEFELRVTIEMQRTSVGGGVQRRSLMVRPVRPDLTTSEAVSVIRGTFLAVPNPTRNVLRVSASVSWQDKTHGVVSVVVRDGAGTLQPGIEVQFNVDRDLSASANQEMGSEFKLSPATTFNDAVKSTDECGRAESTLLIDSREQPGTVIIMVLDAAGQTEVIRHTYLGAQ